MHRCHMLSREHGRDGIEVFPSHHADPRVEEELHDLHVAEVGGARDGAIPVSGNAWTVDLRGWGPTGDDGGTGEVAPAFGDGEPEEFRGEGLGWPGDFVFEFIDDVELCFSDGVAADG